MAAEHSRSDYIMSLAVHQSQRSHPLPANLPDTSNRHRRARLQPSVISDQRFEPTYLNKIKPYIHVNPTDIRPPDSPGLDSDNKGKQKQSEGVTATGGVVTIEWGKVIWITTR